MANDPSNGKNSVLGEFMLSFAKAPEHVQESIMVYAIKAMMPHYRECIAPYPMLSHMTGILGDQGIVDPDSGDSSSDSNAS